MGDAPPMCLSCDKLSRRRVLSFLATGAVAVGLLGAGAPRSRAASAMTMTADEALAKLRAGNQKFLTAPELCAVDLTKRRADVANGQAPWATILTCSDSRVSPELIFGGVGLGELFVVRNAGNVADTAAMGTIEYGAEHLGSPLVVVLGHQRCGAVEAACDVVTKHTKLPGFIAPMVDAIVPAAKAVYGKPGDFVDNAVRENARLGAQKISTRSKIVEHLEHEGKVKVVYARYDLDKGVVDFL
jgi:carbonic anhydrase